MWEDQNFNGSKYVDYVPGTIPNDAFEIDWWDGDNEITSVINNSNKYVVLYDGDGWTGTVVCVRPNSSTTHLGITHGFNDRAESFKLKSSCSP